MDVYIGSVEGTPVYTVVATDPESDSMTYEITCNNSCPFKVSESTYKHFIYMHMYDKFCVYLYELQIFDFIEKLIKVPKVTCRWGYLSLNDLFIFSFSLPDGEILVNGSLSGLNGTDYNVSIFVFDGKNNVGPENITLSISGMRLFNNWSCSWECWLLKMFIYSVATNVHKSIS